MFLLKPLRTVDRMISFAERSSSKIRKSKPSASVTSANRRTSGTFLDKELGECEETRLRDLVRNRRQINCSRWRERNEVLIYLQKESKKLVFFSTINRTIRLNIIISNLSYLQCPAATYVARVASFANVPIFAERI